MPNEANVTAVHPGGPSRKPVHARCGRPALPAADGWMYCESCDESAPWPDDPAAVTS